MNARAHSSVISTVGALMLLLCVGCAQSEPTVVTANEVEEVVFAVYDQEFQDAVMLHTTECARHNGLQQWMPEPVPEVTTIDVAPGLEGAERTAAIGSGIVAGQLALIERREQAVTSAQQALSSTDSVEDQQALDEQRQVLDVGPVENPDDGSLVEFGCRGWAIETVQSSPRFTNAVRVAESYSDFLDESTAGSSVVATLQQKWSSCMADRGYPGIAAQGDQIDLIAEESQRWQRGTISYEQALEFDVAVTTAAVHCNAQIDAELAAFRDSVAAQFLENNPGIGP